MREQNKPCEPESTELTEEQKLAAIADRREDVMLYRLNCEALSQIDRDHASATISNNVVIYVHVEEDGMCNLHVAYYCVPVDCAAWVLAALGVDARELHPVDKPRLQRERKGR